MLSRARPPQWGGKRDVAYAQAQQLGLFAVQPMAYFARKEDISRGLGSTLITKEVILIPLSRPQSF